MRGLSIYDTRLREFKEMISEVEYLKYTLNSLIYWDKITYARRRYRIQDKSHVLSGR